MTHQIHPEILAAINVALELLPTPMDSPEARVMMLTTGLQESRFEFRRQMIKKGGELLPLGPAKSFWQFERGGGCTGVVTHAASRYWMQRVCATRGVAFNATALWNAMENDDVLAAGAARLLYFTDPKRLPGLEDPRAAWNLYKRTWRPGQPHPETWDAFHAQARAVVLGALA